MDAPTGFATSMEPAAAPDTGLNVACRVLRAIDGDTIEVEVRQRYHVRLLDCWAPEKRGPSREEGIASAENLYKIIVQHGQEGVLSVPGGEDVGKSWSMGRVLGYVWLKGCDQSLNEMQVASGHASKERPR